MTPVDGSKVFIKNKKTGKFLFFLRDNKPDIPYPNMWGLLGGGIKKSETPIQALEREIKEESNIEIYNIKKIAEKYITLSVGNKNYKIKGNFFTAETDFNLEDIKLYEGQKLQYFTLEEIEKQDNLMPIIRDAIDDYKDQLK